MLAARCKPMGDAGQLGTIDAIGAAGFLGVLIEKKLTSNYNRGDQRATAIDWIDSGQGSGLAQNVHQLFPGKERPRPVLVIAG